MVVHLLNCNSWVWMGIMGTKSINYQFKILYAIGMILIVAGHAGNGGISLFYDWLPPYAFHLGLFMFASDYFYNDASESNCKAFRLFPKIHFESLFRCHQCRFCRFRHQEPNVLEICLCCSVIL